jgi:hypothetical protein
VLAQFARRRPRTSKRSCIVSGEPLYWAAQGGRVRGATHQAAMGVDWDPKGECALGSLPRHVPFSWSVYGVVTARKPPRCRAVSSAKPGNGGEVCFDLPAHATQVDHSVSSPEPIDVVERLLGLSLLIELSEIGNDCNRYAIQRARFA